jgi:hypothetical protein
VADSSGLNLQLKPSSTVAIYNSAIMKTFLLFITLLISAGLSAQQIADTAYNPEIKHPQYAPAQGPVVYIDEGHHNFHTKNGRYAPFAKLLSQDGYTVRASEGVFRASKLAGCKIMVVANALNKKNVDDWFLPTPSAFTKEEIKTIKIWVEQGGSLFLIADHMPMSGAAMDLAAAFGFECVGGFAIDTASHANDLFTLKDGTLHASIVTTGRDAGENVDQIVSFTGQGFKLPADAIPVLVLNKIFMTIMPDTAWAFKKDTPKISSAGWSQGAYKTQGKGKVVFFGEAAMFTAQLAGPQQNKMGMNSAVAPQNYKLLLNIIHWLDGKLQ